MRLIVERIEDGIAVLEGEDGQFELAAAYLPEGAQEGTVLRLSTNRGPEFSELRLTIDAEGQRLREEQLRKLRSSIPRAPDGDITL